MSEVFVGQDPSYDNQPHEECYLGPNIRSPYLLPDIVNLLMVTQSDIVSFLYAKGTPLRISPPQYIWAFLNLDEAFEHFFLESPPIIQTCKLKFFLKVPLSLIF